MKCIYFRTRIKNYEQYIYCKQKRKRIEYNQCKECKHKEYKKVKELKKKTNKLKKIEDKRFSILTDNLGICYICKKNRKDDLHEIFGGSNRKKSMIWGLVIPICRQCHNEWENNKNLREEVQQHAQMIFEIKYSNDLFMTEFKKNFILGGKTNEI